MELLLVKICILYSITVIDLERCVEICFHFVTEGSLLSAHKRNFKSTCIRFCLFSTEYLPKVKQLVLNLEKLQTENM